MEARRGPGRGWLGALLTAALVTGCGGGGPGGSGEVPAGAQSARVAIALTDAPGDILTYAVIVDSVELTRGDGAKVETVPVNGLVDFAQLTEAAEFVAAASLPPGAYSAVTLHLDFLGAGETEASQQPKILVEGSEAPEVRVRPENILIEGAQGDLRPLSESGGKVAVTLQLEPKRHFVVARGLTSHLTLDFNLAATNEVVFAEGVPTLTVRPVLTAELSRNVGKSHRVRGTLESLDPGEQSFVLALRPFRKTRASGSLTVTTGGRTSFEVNGTQAKGAEGFALLEALFQDQPGAEVLVAGGIDRTTGSIRAAKILAGSSAAGDARDLVRGTVIARRGDVLTVRGSLAAPDRASSAKDAQLEITLPEDVEVARQDLPSVVLGAGAVSIGQRIAVSGSLTGAASVEATRIELLVTTARGVYVARDSSGYAEIELQYLDGKPVGLFDFAGTGTSPADDADPSSYRVATGVLTLADLKNGDPIQFLGFVAPWGAAPPDFEAQTVVNLTEVGAMLRVDWRSGSTPVLSSSGAGLVLDLTDALTHHVFQGGSSLELSAAPDPHVVPRADGTARFTLRLWAPGRKGRHTTTTYGSFAEFQAALLAQLEAGARASCLTAEGLFDTATQTLTAERVHVTVQ
jgi:hypothetical protein